LQITKMTQNITNAIYRSIAKLQNDIGNKELLIEYVKIHIKMSRRQRQTKCTENFYATPPTALCRLRSLRSVQLHRVLSDVVSCKAATARDALAAASDPVLSIITG